MARAKNTIAALRDGIARIFSKRSQGRTGGSVTNTVIRTIGATAGIHQIVSLVALEYPGAFGDRPLFLFPWLSRMKHQFGLACRPERVLHWLSQDLEAAGQLHIVKVKGTIVVFK